MSDLKSDTTDSDDAQIETLSSVSETENNTRQNPRKSIGVVEINSEIGKTSGPRTTSLDDDVTISMLMSPITNSALSSMGVKYSKCPKDDGNTESFNENMTKDKNVDDNYACKDDVLALQNKIKSVVNSLFNLKGEHTYRNKEINISEQTSPIDFDMVIGKFDLVQNNLSGEPGHCEIDITSVTEFQENSMLAKTETGINNSLEDSVQNTESKGIILTSTNIKGGFDVGLPDESTSEFVEILSPDLCLKCKCSRVRDKDNNDKRTNRDDNSLDECPKERKHLGKLDHPFRTKSTQTIGSPKVALDHQGLVSSNDSTCDTMGNGQRQLSECKSVKTKGSLGRTKRFQGLCEKCFKEMSEGVSRIHYTRNPNINPFQLFRDIREQDGDNSQHPKWTRKRDPKKRRNGRNRQIRRARAQRMRRYWSSDHCYSVPRSYGEHSRARFMAWTQVPRPKRVKDVKTQTGDTSVSFKSDYDRTKSKTQIGDESISSNSNKESMPREHGFKDRRLSLEDKNAKPETENRSLQKEKEKLNDHASQSDQCSNNSEHPNPSTCKHGLEDCLYCKVALDTENNRHCQNDSEVHSNASLLHIMNTRPALSMAKFCAEVLYKTSITTEVEMLKYDNSVNLEMPSCQYHRENRTPKRSHKSEHFICTEVCSVQHTNKPTTDELLQEYVCSYPLLNLSHPTNKKSHDSLGIIDHTNQMRSRQTRTPIKTIDKDLSKHTNDDSKSDQGQLKRTLNHAEPSYLHNQRTPVKEDISKSMRTSLCAGDSQTTRLPHATQKKFPSLVDPLIMNRLSKCQVMDILDEFCATAEPLSPLPSDNGEMPDEFMQHFDRILIDDSSDHKSTDKLAPTKDLRCDHTSWHSIAVADLCARCRAIAMTETGCAKSGLSNTLHVISGDEHQENTQSPSENKTLLTVSHSANSQQSPTVKYPSENTSQDARKRRSDTPSQHIKSKKKLYFLDEVPESLFNTNNSHPPGNLVDLSEEGGHCSKNMDVERDIVCDVMHTPVVLPASDRVYHVCDSMAITCAEMNSLTTTESVIEEIDIVDEFFSEHRFYRKLHGVHSRSTYGTSLYIGNAGQDTSYQTMGTVNTVNTDNLLQGLEPWESNSTSMNTDHVRDESVNNDTDKDTPNITLTTLASEDNNRAPTFNLGYSSSNPSCHHWKDITSTTKNDSTSEMSTCEDYFTQVMNPELVPSHPQEMSYSHNDYTMPSDDRESYSNMDAFNADEPLENGNVMEICDEISFGDEFLSDDWTSGYLAALEDFSIVGSSGGPKCTTTTLTDVIDVPQENITFVDNAPCSLEYSDFMPEFTHPARAQSLDMQPYNDCFSIDNLVFKDGNDVSHLMDECSSLDAEEEQSDHFPKASLGGNIIVTHSPTKENECKQTDDIGEEHEFTNKTTGPITRRRSFRNTSTKSQSSPTCHSNRPNDNEGLSSMVACPPVEISSYQGHSDIEPRNYSKHQKKQSSSYSPLTRSSTGTNKRQKICSGISQKMKEKQFPVFVRNLDVINESKNIEKSKDNSVETKKKRQKKSTGKKKSPEKCSKTSCHMGKKVTTCPITQSEPDEKEKDQTSKFKNHLKSLCPDFLKLRAFVKPSGPLNKIPMKYKTPLTRSHKKNLLGKNKGGTFSFPSHCTDIHIEDSENGLQTMAMECNRPIEENLNNNANFTKEKEVESSTSKTCQKDKETSRKETSPQQETEYLKTSDAQNASSYSGNDSSCSKEITDECENERIRMDSGGNEIHSRVYLPTVFAEKFTATMDQGNHTQTHFDQAEREQHPCHQSRIGRNEDNSKNCASEFHNIRASSEEKANSSHTDGTLEISMEETEYCPPGLARFVNRLNSQYGEMLARQHNTKSSKLRNMCKHYMEFHHVEGESLPNDRTKMERYRAQLRAARKRLEMEENKSSNKAENQQSATLGDSLASCSYNTDQLERKDVEHEDGNIKERGSSSSRDSGVSVETKASMNLQGQDCHFRGCHKHLTSGNRQPNKKCIECRYSGFFGKTSEPSTRQPTRTLQHERNQNASVSSRKKLKQDKSLTMRSWISDKLSNGEPCPSEKDKVSKRLREYENSNDNESTCIEDKRKAVSGDKHFASTSKSSLASKLPPLEKASQVKKESIRSQFQLPCLPKTPSTKNRICIESKTYSQRDNPTSRINSGSVKEKPVRRTSANRKSSGDIDYKCSNRRNQFTADHESEQFFEIPKQKAGERGSNIPSLPSINEFSRSINASSPRKETMLKSDSTDRRLHFDANSTNDAVFSQPIPTHTLKEQAFYEVSLPAGFEMSDLFTENNLQSQAEETVGKGRSLESIQDNIESTTQSEEHSDKHHEDRNSIESGINNECTSFEFPRVCGRNEKSLQFDSTTSTHSSRKKDVSENIIPCSSDSNEHFFKSSDVVESRGDSGPLHMASKTHTQQRSLGEVSDNLGKDDNKTELNQGEDVNSPRENDYDAVLTDLDNIGLNDSDLVNGDGKNYYNEFEIDTENEQAYPVLSLDSLKRDADRRFQQAFGHFSFMPGHQYLERDHSPELSANSNCNPKGDGNIDLNLAKNTDCHGQDRATWNENEQNESSWCEGENTPDKTTSRSPLEATDIAQSSLGGILQEMSVDSSRMSDINDSSSPQAQDPGQQLATDSRCNSAKSSNRTTSFRSLTPILEVGELEEEDNK